MSKRFTKVEVGEVWERRTAGESTRSIARRLERSWSSIRRLFEDACGVRPVPERTHQLDGRPRQTLNWMTASRKLADAMP